jgi:DNA helicase MCM9
MDEYLDPDSEVGGIRVNEFFEFFTKFISRRYTAQIESILLQSDSKLHYPLEISWQELVAEEPDCTMFLEKATLLLPLVDQAIALVQRSILDTRNVETPGHRMTFKTNVHGRFYDILGRDPKRLFAVRAPRSKHTGNMIQMSGTVIRAGLMKMIEWSRTFECAKCHHRFVIHVDLEQQGNKFCKVLRCPSSTSTAHACPGRTFNHIDSERVCKDYQEIKLQEEMKTLEVGSIPRSTIVVLHDDLVDSCQPGDDVKLVGVVLQRWRTPVENDRCDIEVFVVANHLLVSNQKEVRPEATDGFRAKFIEFWDAYRYQPLMGMVVRTNHYLIANHHLIAKHAWRNNLLYSHTSTSCCLQAVI